MKILPSGNNCFKSLGFYQTFLLSVLLLTLFFNHMGSVTPGFDTDFVDVNHDRDSAGVGGAQLHHLSSERVQKRMLPGGA